MKRGLLSFVLLMPLLAGAAPAGTIDVVSAINALGLDLYRVQPGDGNLLLSPYSIQNVLAITYAGAAGDTRAEMQRVLHYPADDTAIHAGFAELAKELAQIQQDSAQAVAVEAKDDGRHPSTPVELHVANRLFVQNGYPLRAPFLALVKDNYGAEPELVDFRSASEQARLTINQWAEDNTKGKIRDVIPSDGVSKNTRLALVNAIYLHAPWAHHFNASVTEPEPFFVGGSKRVLVPTMTQRQSFGYAHDDDDGFAVISLPYQGGGLQFLILLPDSRNGLAALEQKITPELFSSCTKLPSMDEVILHLPKLRLEPPSLALGEELERLGMKTAFDIPKRSANFDRMASRKPKDYLAISKVFQKAFLLLDEEGTEAAAITAVMEDMVGARLPKVIEVRVDHPFIFAIQHVPSGECLFLGRVVDPR